MISKICDGCVGENKTRHCFVKTDFNVYDDCPCGHCIIKVMCRRFCLERAYYYVDRKTEEKNNA